MSSLLLFAAIGLLGSPFTPVDNLAPSLELIGMTNAGAVVHIYVDEAEKVIQADTDGKFDVKAWNLKEGDHDIILSASSANANGSQDKEYVITIEPGVNQVTLSDIDLSIKTSKLNDGLQKFDLNHDDKFSQEDIFLFIKNHNTDNMELDFNHDEKVNLRDFSVMMSYYLSIVR